jgi:cytochrome c oxidase assembly protein subunit 15
MEKRFLLISKITLVGILLIFLAGSVVRMTGSGMGCPDWPTCFGKLIPPTSETQLDPGYREKFTEQRLAKMEKTCKLLERLGFKEDADKIRQDPKLREEQPFNAANTWTEFINRLVGALSGLAILLQLYFSVRLFRQRKDLFLLTFINLILFGFNAWWGSIVVASNLVPWIISLHMIAGLLSVWVQVYIIVRASGTSKSIRIPAYLYIMLLSLIALSIVQILMGTQIRQQVDDIYDEMGGRNRSLWIEQLDLVFYIHRSFSWLVVLFTGFMFYKLKNLNIQLPGMSWILGIVLEEVISGAAMSYFSVPPFMQPVHLVLSTVMLAMQLRQWFVSRISA